MLDPHNKFFPRGCSCNGEYNFTQHCARGIMGGGYTTVRRSTEERESFSCLPACSDVRDARAHIRTCARISVCAHIMWQNENTCEGMQS